jgi:hypothetical protein
MRRSIRISIHYLCSMSNPQPWIYRPLPDLTFILAPAFVSVAIVLAFPNLQSAMSPVAWLILVAGIDVAHVYSTLWRTYLDPEERHKYRMHLISIPILAYLAGVAVYLAGGMLFWRIMAYLAVYHFIRQQYGFMSLYARNDGRATWERYVDAIAIYAATIYPLIHWHTHLPRPFSWFVEGDFWPLQFPWLSVAAGILYLLILTVYAGKEVLFAFQGRRVNVPKNLVLIGTALSWYVGIVFLQGDMAFTLTNVVSHGIPYMALVWMYGRKKSERKSKPGTLGRFFQLRYLWAFVGLLLLLAYFEEGLWDSLIWRDHVGLFPWAAEIFPAIQTDVLLAFVVPFLALPQVTHYVLDGFIWKLRHPQGDLRSLS